MPFTQIGSEGGYLPEPVRLRQLLIAPAERADVIVDFTERPARDADRPAQYRARTNRSAAASPARSSSRPTRPPPAR